jgi:hypothetical protein
MREAHPRPQPGEPQHMAALRHANEVRLARADVKEALNRKEIGLGTALREDCVGSMMLGELLRSQKRWGYVRAARLMAALAITDKPIKDLTERQRKLIIENVNGGPPYEDPAFERRDS